MTIMVDSSLSEGSYKYLTIIGSMKSGTSTLFDLLSTHPDILPSIVKEPEFFSLYQSHKFEGLTKYEDLWPERDDHPGAYLLEASTGYTKFPAEPGVAERMIRAKVRPKLIYIVRDPIKRIESQINFSIRTVSSDPTANYTDPVYVNQSRYALQLDQYVAFFEKSEILILDFDDLVKNPRTLCNKVSAFLGIDDRFEIGAAKVIKNETRLETVGERLVFRTPRLNRVFWSLPYRVRKIIHEKLLLKTAAAVKIALTESQKSAVFGWLSEDMKRLREEYGFDTTKWGFG